MVVPGKLATESRYACMLVGFSVLSDCTVFRPVVYEVGPPAPLTDSSRPLSEASLEVEPDTAFWMLFSYDVPMLLWVPLCEAIDHLLPTVPAPVSVQLALVSQLDVQR